MTDDEIDACFAAGRNSPEWGKCPYHPATREAHWWTLGFAHTARLLRAIDAERDAKRYRRLGALVEFGDWGVCRCEVVDSFGRTEETHMDDKTDMDAWLDKPEVIAEAEACLLLDDKTEGLSMSEAGALRTEKRMMTTPPAEPSQPTPSGQWQPIVTAPRSDVQFLAYRPLAHLTHDPNISIVSGSVRDQGCWDETVPTGMQKMNYTSGYCMPTHWMPLPSAPARCPP